MNMTYNSRSVIRFLWFIRVTFWGWVIIVVVRVRYQIIIDNFYLSWSSSLPLRPRAIFFLCLFLHILITTLTSKLLDKFLVIEVELAFQKIFMVLLHDVFHLVKILLWKFIAVLENGFDFVVDCIEGVEILLLEMTFLCLVSKQRNLVCNFFVILYWNFDSSILKIQ
jgi:hypothetical protein